MAYLIPWAATQAVRVKLVDVQHMDGALYAQVMQLARDLQEEEVALPSGMGERPREDLTGTAAC